MKIKDSAKPFHPKLSHDRRSKAITLQWGELGKQHIGVTEELNLIGCTVLFDRDKKGRIQAIEILY